MISSPATPVRVVRRYDSHSGFSLLELLIVITVIMLLAGILLPLGINLREKAYELQTKVRMQHILNALTIYGHDTSNRCVNLQLACGLGGTGTFDTVDHIWNNNSGISSIAPPFVDKMSSNAAQTFIDVTFDSSNFTSVAGGNNIEITTLFRTLGSQLFEVVPPPGVGWSASDFTNAWPTQWPETDWDLGSPGTHPPILRFPWGKVGLRIDGKLCDPSVPEGLGYPNPTQFEEWMTSHGFIDQVYESTGNSWVTFGSPLTTRIWNWSTTNPSQTDWVTLGSATRSDGTPATAIATNAPMPFDMGWMSPLQTMPLLQAAGILPPGPAGLDAYRTDRSRAQPWNDAWGNPLVVVYALFQPERYVRTFDNQNRRDLLLRGALEAYHYNRSVYLAVASAGAQLDIADFPAISQNWPASEDATVLAGYWKQVRQVCNAVAWNETGFESPPWQDVKIGKGSGCVSLLTAPCEIK